MPISPLTPPSPTPIAPSRSETFSARKRSFFFRTNTLCLWFALLCLAFHSVDSIPLYMCIYGASGSESGYAWGCDNSSIWEGEGWARFGWKWYRACFTLSCSYQPSMLLWTLITINICLCLCLVILYHSQNIVFVLFWLTEMPRQEQRYPQVSWWHLCEWEKRNCCGRLIITT